MNLNKIHTCLFLEKSESYSDSLLLFSKSMEKSGVKLLQYKQKAAVQRRLNAGKQLELTIPIIGLVVCYNIYKKQVNCKSEGNVLGVEKEPKGDAHFCK